MLGSILLAFLFVSNSALADSSIFDAGGLYESTSDDFFRSAYNIDYRNHRRYLLWPYEGEDSKGTDWGINVLHTRGQSRTETFCGTRASVLLGHKYSEKYQIDVSLGGHNLRPSVSESKLIGYGQMILGFYPDKSYGGALRVARDYLYQDLVLPAGLLEALSATTVELRLLGMIGDRWRTPTMLSLRNYSDANQRTEADLGVMYGISPGTPWIWAGIGVNQIRNTKTQPNYYTPSLFSGFGPRLDLSVPFYTNWTLSAALNLNRFYDQDSSSWGSGHYASTKLQYGDRNKTNYSLQYISINALRSSGIWVSSTIGLFLSTPL